MSPVEWSPCRPRTIQLPLTASPCSRLSRPQSTISQSDFRPVIRPFSPLRLGRSYRLAPEPDGSPLFTLLPLVACWRYRTPGAPRTARVVAACDSAFPFERQGRLLRSRSISGLYSRSLHSGLQPPCLRFATAVTGRHARLGSRLLARLYRGRHCRRQTSTRLQGATLVKPGVPISGTRLSDWLHRKAHEDKLTARGFGTMSNSPSPLDTAISGGACHCWCLQAHRQSPRPRHLQKRTRSRGTLLHRHYPVSTLLLPRPTPAVTTA